MSRSFTFDAENRMTSATVNGTTPQFGYASEGRRVTKLAVPGGANELYCGHERSAV